MLKAFATMAKQHKIEKNTTFSSVKYKKLGCAGRKMSCTTGEINEAFPPSNAWGLEEGHGELYS